MKVIAILNDMYLLAIFVVFKIKDIICQKSLLKS
jgi:hypothetical protein